MAPTSEIRSRSDDLVAIWCAAMSAQALKTGGEKKLPRDGDFCEPMCGRYRVTRGRLVLIKNIGRGRGEVGCTEKTTTHLISVPSHVLLNRGLWRSE